MIGPRSVTEVALGELVNTYPTEPGLAAAYATQPDSDP
jgi:hypothetical protein